MQRISIQNNPTEEKKHNTWEKEDKIIDQIIDLDYRVLRYRSSVVYKNIAFISGLLLISFIVLAFNSPKVCLSFVILSGLCMIISMREHKNCHQGHQESVYDMERLLDTDNNRENLKCVKHMIDYCNEKKTSIVANILQGKQLIATIKLENIQLMKSSKHFIAAKRDTTIQTNKFRIENEESANEDREAQKTAILNTLKMLTIHKTNIEFVINTSKQKALEEKILLNMSSTPTHTKPDIPACPEIDAKNVSKPDKPVSPKSEPLPVPKPKQYFFVEHKPNKKTQAVLAKIEARMQRKELKESIAPKKMDGSKSHSEAQQAAVIKVINANIAKCKSSLNLITQCLVEIQQIGKNSETKAIENRVKMFIPRMNNTVARCAEAKSLSLVKLNTLAMEAENQAKIAEQQYQKLLAEKIDLLQQTQSQVKERKSVGKNVANAVHQANIAIKLKILGIKDNKEDWIFDLHKGLGKSGILEFHGSAVVEFARHKYHLASKTINVNDIDMRISGVKNEDEVIAMLTKMGFVKGKECPYYITFSLLKNGKKFDLTITRPEFMSYDPIHISRHHMIYEDNGEWRIIDKNEELENALTNSRLDSDLPSLKHKVTMLFARFIKYRLKFPTFAMENNFKEVLYSYEWQANYFAEKMAVTDARQYVERDACYAEVFSIIERGYLKTFENCYSILCAFFTALLKEKVTDAPSLLASNLATIMLEYFLANPISVTKITISDTRHNFYHAINYMVSKADFFRNELSETKEIGFECMKTMLDDRVGVYESKDSFSQARLLPPPKSQEELEKTMSALSLNVKS